MDMQRELERALRQLRNGKDPSQVIESLSCRLINKLLHAPTQAARACGPAAGSTGTPAEV